MILFPVHKKTFLNINRYANEQRDKGNGPDEQLGNMKKLPDTLHQICSIHKITLRVIFVNLHETLWTITNNKHNVQHCIL